MCSNFEPIKIQRANWVKQNLGCDLPPDDWRPETFPTYSAPIVYYENGQTKCDLASFGLIPHWADDKKKFGLKTYNARSETVAEKPSYRSAWKERRFGLILTKGFTNPVINQVKQCGQAYTEVMANLLRYSNFTFILNIIRANFAF